MNKHKKLKYGLQYLIHLNKAHNKAEKYYKRYYSTVNENDI